MIAALALGSDNKRYFRGQLPRLAIGTIILMPLLYGAMYLWAFWNPFGEVNKIPAAIVNLDEGASQKGKPLHAGRDVVEKLVESDELDLDQVSAKDAAAGLADGTFYFTITLPRNFSAAIVSPEGSDPEKAKLRFTFNDANSYLSTVIGEDASEQVINKINSTIGAQAVEQVLVTIEDSGSELEKAVEGAGELASGLSTANTGAGKLASGAVELDNGIGEAHHGTEELSAGTGELRSKLDGVIAPALGELDSAGLKRFDAKVGGLAEEAEAAVALAASLESGALAQAIDRAIGTLRRSDVPGAREAADALAAAVSGYRSDVQAVQGAIAKLRSDLRSLQGELHASREGGLEEQLASIEQRLAADIEELRSGVDRLDSGALKLNSGLAKLQEGSGKLVSGTGQLSSGTVKLLNGANELQSGLQEGLEKVPDWTERQRQATADTLSTPVDLVKDVDNEAPTFGTGFAPFFCSLALFVGGILCWMLLTPLQSRAVVSGLGTYRTALASYVPALLVGALQATVLFAVVKFGLGLQATHPVAMWLFMLLISATFLSMIQAFNAVFDVAIGRVVTLAFLMVQLISAGGIYPVPTTAVPFQVIHPLDPMTYTVDGLRQVTVAHAVDSRLWVAIAVLLGIILLAITVTAWAAQRNRQYTMERLYPSIEV